MVEFRNLLTKSNFKYLWFSQILSQVTINMLNFLILIKLFNHTGSTLAISFLWISYALPTIIVGPFASALVDLVDKKKVLIYSNFFQFLVIVFASMVVQENVFLLYGIAFFYSFLNQFYVPSESAMVPRLVEKESLPNANSLFFLTQQISMVVGFSLSGVLASFIGFNFSLFVCSVLLLLATISVLFLPKEESRQFKSSIYEDSFVEFFKTFFEGYRYLKNKKSIYIPFILLLGVQACFAVVIVSIPVIARDILMVDTNLSGILLVVPAGIGAVFGATYFPKFLRKGWRKRHLIETGSLILGVLFLVYALLLGLLPAFPRGVLSFVMVVFIGTFFVSILIPTQTFLQEVTPNDLRGRIFGSMWFLVTLTQVIPIIFSGALVEVFGIRFLLVVISAYCGSIYYVSKKTRIKLMQTI